MEKEEEERKKMNLQTLQGNNLKDSGGYTLLICLRCCLFVYLLFCHLNKSETYSERKTKQ